MSPLLLPRVLAFVLDWLLLAVWGGLLFGVVYMVTGGEFGAAPGFWRAEAVSFGLMTLPFAMYFAVLESRPGQASVGKRVVKLRVEGLGGERLGLGRALIRALIKFVPWELGHIQVNLALAGVEGAPLFLAAALCWLGIFGYAYLLASGAQMPYDLAVGARVVRATPGAR